jgi:hypothetical protein
MHDILRKYVCEITPGMRKYACGDHSECDTWKHERAASCTILEGQPFVSGTHSLLPLKNRFSTFLNLLCCFPDVLLQIQKEVDCTKNSSICFVVHDYYYHVKCNSMCFGSAVQSCELELPQEFQKAVSIYLLTFLKAIYVCITQSCIDRGKQT